MRRWRVSKGSLFFARVLSLRRLCAQWLRCCARALLRVCCRRSLNARYGVPCFTLVKKLFFDKASVETLRF